VVTIGVTGHRILAEVDRLETGLDEVVRRLEATFPDAWTVISALAEGSDRLVSNRLLARPATRLVVVLPVERRDYETDFETEASRAEFHDLLGRAAEVIEVAPQPSRDEAYEAGGLTVLERADVLVAIWDGQRAQGRGGTGGVVAKVRERGLPLAWVHAGNRRPGTDVPTSLGGEQGAVTFERLPHPER
jgi:hypothetical protein